MKKVRFIITAILAVVLCCAAVMPAMAARGEEKNPFKHAYAKEAQMARKPGTAKLIYHFMDAYKAPIPNCVMIYNTTKGKDLRAQADQFGKIEFDVKDSELYYIRQVEMNGQTYPVSGYSLINNVEKTDIRKGLVIYNVIIKYGDAAFMSYRGD